MYLFININNHIRCLRLHKNYITQICKPKTNIFSALSLFSSRYFFTTNAELLSVDNTENKFSSEDVLTDSKFSSFIILSATRHTCTILNQNGKRSFSSGYFPLIYFSIIASDTDGKCTSVKRDKIVCNREAEFSVIKMNTAYSAVLQTFLKTCFVPPR